MFSGGARCYSFRDGNGSGEWLVASLLDVGSHKGNTAEVDGPGSGRCRQAMGSVSKCESFLEITHNIFILIHRGWVIAVFMDDSPMF